MCNKCLITLFVFTFCTATGTRAQQSFDYSFRHIDQADGLLHNDVLSIAQDGKGFIWIATHNGLQRYDGSRFIYYPDMLSNPIEGLTPGAEMYADKKNNLLWITNDVSLEKMEVGKNLFTIYDAEKLLTDTSFSFSVYTGVNNQQWLLAGHAVYRYDKISNKNVIQRYNTIPATAHKNSFFATNSAGTNTWISTNKELFLFG